MKKITWLIALLLVLSTGTYAQTAGPLSIQNNLSEIARNGSGAQSAARSNLGIVAPIAIPTAPLLGGATGAYTSITLDGTLAETGTVLGVVTGTSGNAIPLLSGTNVWGGSQMFNNSTIFAGPMTLPSNLTLATPTLTSPTITGTISGNPTIPSPTITGTIAGNPTITTPTITSPVITGTVTGGADISAEVSKPGSGTTTLSIANQNALTLNMLYFGPGGVPVDRTGTTDASGAWQAAITAACAAGSTAIPVKLMTGGGTYLVQTVGTFPNTCNNVTVQGDGQGVTKFIQSPTNSSTSGTIIRGTSNGNYNSLHFKDFTLDGNLANAPTATAAVAQIGVSGTDVVFENITIQNTRGIGLNFGAGAVAATGVLASDFTPPGNSLVLTSIPAGLHVGATASGIGELLYNYVTAIDVPSKTVTFAYNLPYQIDTAWTIGFTPAVTLTADAISGSSSLTVDVVTNMAANAVLIAQPYNPAASNCVQPNTHILTATGTTITIDKPLMCTITSGNFISAIRGFQNSGVRNLTLKNVGQYCSTSGTLSTTTVGSTAAGSPMVLNSVAGLFQGDKVTTVIAGMPTNNIVSTISSTTITFVNPTTQTINGGTAIAFAIQGPQADCSHGVNWSSGALWANTDNFVNLAYAEDTGLSSMIISNQSRFRVSDFNCQNNYSQWRNLTGSGFSTSACLYAVSVDGLTYDRIIANQSTGTGIDVATVDNLSITNSLITNNAADGITWCDGKNGVFNNNRIVNNGQGQIWPLHSLTNSAIGLLSCGSSFVGGVSNVSVNGNVAGDDQASRGLTPTQLSFITTGWAPTVVVNANVGNNSLFGMPNLYTKTAGATAVFPTSNGQLRTITATGAATATIDDAAGIITMAKTTPAATAMAVPACNDTTLTGLRITVQDGNGDASSNPTTLTTSGGLINGSSSKVLNTNYGRLTLSYIAAAAGNTCVAN